MPPESLSGLGLDPKLYSVVPARSSRLICSIEGEEGSGKTWLALDAPDPIVYLAGDRNYEGVLHQKAGGRVIIPSFFSFKIPARSDNPNDVAAEARPIRDKFLAAYRGALKSKVKSVVIDTGGWVLNLIRYARFGTIHIQPAVLHAETNALFQRLLDEGHESGKNIIWIHRLRDEREDKEKTLKDGKKIIDAVRTGRQEMVGYSMLPFEMQLIIRLESAAPLGFGLPLVGTITKSTLGMHLVGKQFRSDSKVNKLRFATIASRAMAEPLDDEE